MIIGEHNINILRYAGDTVLIAENKAENMVVNQP